MHHLFSPLKTCVNSHLLLKLLRLRHRLPILDTSPSSQPRPRHRRYRPSLCFPPRCLSLATLTAIADRAADLGSCCNHLLGLPSPPSCFPYPTPRSRSYPRHFASLPCLERGHLSSPLLPLISSFLTGTISASNSHGFTSVQIGCPSEAESVDSPLPLSI
jgi:hypothetical protein